MSTAQSPSSQLPMPANALALPSFPARYARFGNFQIDSERQELLHSGQRVRMQAKVFQTLLILVSQAGNIVTREEVGRRLWPGRSSSTLDANVNTAMNKLRQALGDSTDNPVYVETIPRRGYSFMAPLEFSDVAELATIESGQGSKPVAEVRTPFTASSPQFGYNLPMALRVATLLLAGMVVGALLTIAWYSFYNRNHKTLNSTQNLTVVPSSDHPVFRP